MKLVHFDGRASRSKWSLSGLKVEQELFHHAFPVFFSFHRKMSDERKETRKMMKKRDSGCQWCMSVSYNLRPVTHINSSKQWKGAAANLVAKLMLENRSHIYDERIKGCICGCFTVKVNNVLHFRGEAIILLFLTRFHPFQKKSIFFQIIYKLLTKTIKLLLKNERKNRNVSILQAPSFSQYLETICIQCVCF